MNQIAALDYDRIKYRLYERNGSLVLSLQVIRQEYDEFNNVFDKTVGFYVVREPKNIKDILSSLANSSKRISLEGNDLMMKSRSGDQLVVKNYETLQKRRELKQFSNKLEEKIEKLKLKKKGKNVKVYDTKNRILKIKHIAHKTIRAMVTGFTIGGAIGGIAGLAVNSFNSSPIFPKQMQERRTDEEPVVDKSEQEFQLRQSFSESNGIDLKSGIVSNPSNLENISNKSLKNIKQELPVQAVDVGTDVLNNQVDNVNLTEEDNSSSLTEGKEKIEESQIENSASEQKIEDFSTTNTSEIEQNQDFTAQIDKAIEQANEDMKIVEEQTISFEQPETGEFKFDISLEETNESLKGALATEEDIKSIEAASQEEVENIISQAPTTEVQASEPVAMLNDDEITEIAKQMLASNATGEEIAHVANALVSGENLNATPQYGINYIEKYGLTPEQIDTIKATVRQEAGTNPRENYAVMSTIIRRCESGIWGGTNPYDVITAKGQFTAYLKGHYLKYANGNYPECTDEIVDAMLTGQLEPFHNKESFSSGSGATGEQYTSNGNHFR